MVVGFQHLPPFIPLRLWLHYPAHAGRLGYDFRNARGILVAHGQLGDILQMLGGDRLAVGHKNDPVGQVEAGQSVAYAAQPERAGALLEPFLGVRRHVQLEIGLLDQLANILTTEKTNLAIRYTPNITVPAPIMADKSTA